MVQKRRADRDDCRDWDVPRCGAEKTARIDLGLALLSRVALPGVQYTQQEIAAWCGCLDGSILLIEKKALRKLRERLLFLKDPVLRELIAHFFSAAPGASPGTPNHLSGASTASAVHPRGAGQPK